MPSRGSVGAFLWPVLRLWWRRYVPFLLCSIRNEHRLLPARRDVEINQPQLTEKQDRLQRLHSNADRKAALLISIGARQMILRH